jgi:hypothetical protein
MIRHMAVLVVVAAFFLGAATTRQQQQPLRDANRELLGWLVSSHRPGSDEAVIYPGYLLVEPGAKEFELIGQARVLARPPLPVTREHRRPPAALLRREERRYHGLATERSPRIFICEIGVDTGCPSNPRGITYLGPIYALGDGKYEVTSIVIGRDWGADAWRLVYQKIEGQWRNIEGQRLWEVTWDQLPEW